MANYSLKQIEHVARAINGPRDLSGVYSKRPERLDELRVCRWSWLTEQDRGVRLEEARAAVTEWQRICNG